MRRLLAITKIFRIILSPFRIYARTWVITRFHSSQRGTSNNTTIITHFIMRVTEDSQVFTVWCITIISMLTKQMLVHSNTTMINSSIINKLTILLLTLTVIINYKIWLKFRTNATDRVIQSSTLFLSVLNAKKAAFVHMNKNLLSQRQPLITNLLWCQNHHAVVILKDHRICLEAVTTLAKPTSTLWDHAVMK
jgi:hypothetical protein